MAKEIIFVKDGVLCYLCFRFLPAFPTAIFHLSFRSPILTLHLCLGGGRGERAIPRLKFILKIDLPLCNIMDIPERHEGQQLNISVLHVGMNSKYSILKLRVLEGFVTSLFGV